ncbi:unnamed protein product [Blepharisma stoltei]|uniref:Uncharacterized protein n=1 Tax=Blepharisma stoltei TaxID=1481888 RepID=A0AAU9IF41_9CILI|nr:unnamed protein product [Blepharisma stoltei]
MDFNNPDFFGFMQHALREMTPEQIKEAQMKYFAMLRNTQAYQAPNIPPQSSPKIQNSFEDLIRPNSVENKSVPQPPYSRYQKYENDEDFYEEDDVITSSPLPEMSNPSDQQPMEEDFENYLTETDKNYDKNYVSSQSQPHDFDEIPVAGVKKTFEQLLEEKIKYEEIEGEDSKPVQKREFLKRNSGKLAANKIIAKRVERPKPFAEEKARKFTEEKPKLVIEEKPRLIMEEKSRQNIEEPAENSKPAKPFLKRGEGKNCLKGDEKAAKPEKSQMKSLSPRKKDNKPSSPKPQPKPLQKTQKQAKQPKEDKAIDDDAIIFDSSALQSNETRPSEPKKIKIPISNDPSKQEPKLPTNPSPPKPGSTEEKVQKLNQEIENIKSKSQEVRNTTKELESSKKAIEDQLIVLLEFKDAQIKELEKWKDSEIKRMQKERKQAEVNARAALTAQPQNKKEKEEIEELKSAIFKFQEESKIKEIKQKETLEKLKQELTQINTHNALLETQLRMLDQQRIKENWGKKATIKYSIL